MWIDLSSTETIPAPVVHKNLKNKLTEGVTLYKDNTFLLTREKTLSTISPGGDAVVEVSAENKDSFIGIPRWDGADHVLVCNFVKRHVAKVNTSDLASPSVVFSEATVGYPEPGIFWNGKCVIPCGYQGLLIEK